MLLPGEAEFHLSLRANLGALLYVFKDIILRKAHSLGCRRGIQPQRDKAWR